MTLYPPAIVPAMGCPKCGRLVPVTGYRGSDADQKRLKRALRAQRRRAFREG